jgi:hypothetical protein
MQILELYIIYYVINHEGSKDMYVKMIYFLLC